MRLSRLSANPHLYDYVHDLRFQEDGTVEFVDGAGQVVTTLAHGTYQTTDLGEEKLQIDFGRITVVNPYDRSKRPRNADPDHIEVIKVPTSHYPKLREVPGFTVHCTREQGLFAFLEQGHWVHEDEAQWPYLVFTERYIFDDDPLAFGNESQHYSLFYQMSSAQSIERLRASSRFYYAHEGRRRLPWYEVTALGLSKSDVLG